MILRDRGDLWHVIAQPGRSRACDVMTQAFCRDVFSDQWGRPALSVAVSHRDDGRGVRPREGRPVQSMRGVVSAPAALKATFGILQELRLRANVAVDEVPDGTGRSMAVAT